MPEYVTTPWGAYETIHEAKNFKVKLLIVSPGKRTSLQRHQNRAESWAVASGQAKITIEDCAATITGGSIKLPGKKKFWGTGSFCIDAGVVHRIENHSKTEPLIIVETQVGECEESDIVRLEDDWGRK
jgi:mannose-1-phosphate guanylyltransferase